MINLCLGGHQGFDLTWYGRQCCQFRGIQASAFSNKIISSLESYKLELAQRMKRELQVWQSLEHMNIVPLYGIVERINFGRFPAMVSPWMKNGTLAEYMKQNDIALTMGERLKIVSLMTKDIHCSILSNGP
jgi:serine/threonine protein kinase